MVEEEKQPQEDLITQDGIKAVSDKGIDYQKLTERFGCQKLTPEIIERMEKLTGTKAPPIIRRGFFYAHRDFNLILDQYENGRGFYLYTGRGPSSGSLHMGHVIPFLITKYLQDAFKVPLVIQITDDEKYLYRPKLSLKECRKNAISNIKDILAFGFDQSKTFIFSDVDYIQYLYPNVLAVQKHVTFNQVKGIFGVDESSNCGRIAFPAVQAVPAFSSSFPHIFGTMKNVPCLIPCAIDQDPYFRMTRDVAERIGFKKPASLLSKFFPALQGMKEKMSASDLDSTIFVDDKEHIIKKKINKAFSGGKDTKEEQLKYGADIEVDIPVQFLRFFWEDEEGLAKLEEEYKAGVLMSGHVKQQCIKVIQQFIKAYQARRKAVTDQQVKNITAIKPMKPFEGFKKPVVEKKPEEAPAEQEAKKPEEEQPGEVKE